MQRMTYPVGHDLRITLSRDGKTRRAAKAVSITTWLKRASLAGRGETDIGQRGDIA